MIVHRIRNIYKNTTIIIINMKARYNLLLSIISCLIVLWLNGFFLVNIINPIKNSPPLPDIGFFYLPEMDPFYPNILLTIFAIYFATRFIRTKNLEIFIKLIWYNTIIFTIRLFCFITTILPPIRTDCYYRKESDPLEWLVIIKIIMINSNTCIDYIFSGHTSYFVLLYLSFFKFSSYKIEKILFLPYAIIGIICIIAARLHYTVDIIVAVSMTTTVYLLVVSRG